ncbi:MAG: hypothetical protein AMK73_08310 [Planctomycetes bacterium SM23_32]|nr:MAG: hypothetical protein AMK73_08310 [Planctomycetes bacterium SM23_32]
MFVHGRSFFIAWLDTFDDTVTTGEWYQASMAVTPGDSAAAAAPPIDWLPESPASELDGTFELSSTQAVRLSDGTKVELPGHAPSSGWQIPAAGSLDAAVSHSGGNSAKIVNTSGDCTLFQHELPLSQYPPGTRLRLRAWVRGRDIVRGDSDWKAGMAGFSFAMPDGSWQHSPAEYVDGTFDWRELAIDAVVPPEAASARVRLGINGGTGTIWIDDVSLEQLP